MREEIFLVKDDKDINNIILLEEMNNLIEDYEKEISNYKEEIAKLLITKSSIITKLIIATILIFGINLTGNFFTISLNKLSIFPILIEVLTSFVAVLMVETINYQDQRASIQRKIELENKILELANELDKCKTKKQELTRSGEKDYSKSYTLYKWNPDIQKYSIADYNIEKEEKGLSKIKKIY